MKFKLLSQLLNEVYYKSIKFLIIKKWTILKRNRFFYSNFAPIDKCYLNTSEYTVKFSIFQ